MIGFHFSNFDPNEQGKSKFDQLLDLFMQLLTYTSGDVAEALNWLNQLDRQYELTNDAYGMGDFIEELKEKGFITEDEGRTEIKITPKTEQGIRKRSLEEIFGKLKKTRGGDHQTFKPGLGDEASPDTRPFQFGDKISHSVGIIGQFILTVQLIQPVERFGHIPAGVGQQLHEQV